MMMEKTKEIMMEITMETMRGVVKVMEMVRVEQCSPGGNDSALLIGSIDIVPLQIVISLAGQSEVSNRIAVEIKSVGHLSFYDDVKMYKQERSFVVLVVWCSPYTCIYGYEKTCVIDHCDNFHFLKSSPY